MAHLRSVLPEDRFLEVDYEDLVSEPDRVTREMVSFCGLEWDDACLRPEQTPAPFSPPACGKSASPSTAPQSTAGASLSPGSASSGNSLRRCRGRGQAQTSPFAAPSGSLSRSVDAPARGEAHAGEGGVGE